MEKIEFTKKEYSALMSDVEAKMASAREMLEVVAPAIETKFAHCIEKNAGKLIVLPNVPNRTYELKDVEIIISVFGNFITLYFIDDAGVAALKKSMLTEDEKDSGVWDYVSEYRRGNCSPKDFARYAEIEQARDIAFCIKLNPSHEDVGVMFEAQSIDIKQGEESLCLYAGDMCLSEIRFTSDECE